MLHMILHNKTIYKNNKYPQKIKKNRTFAYRIRNKQQKQTAMNKIVRTLLTLTAATIILSSCGNGNPRNRGIEAGKAACQCYNLEDFEAVDSCIKKIEQENAEFLNDTAYTNAMEEQILRCLTDGVIDF